MSKYVTIFLLFISSFSYGQNSQYLKLIGKVSLDSLKKHEYKLASSEFSGRLVNTSTGLLSSKYISNCFENNGLKAILDNGKSYSQKFLLDVKQQKVSETGKPNSGFSAQNIIGILPGRNQKQSHLIITAHHDHMGIVDNEILYGADDNGSGISALIEISRILSTASKQGIRAKRTIVFLSTDAEEKRLLGSYFYVNNPVLPIKNVFCNINLDMIGRIDSAHLASKNLHNYIYCIYKDSTNQVFNDSYLSNINEKYTQLIFDKRYEKEAENTKPYSFITRSDHYPFMKRGIPSIWFFSGFHNDYHQTTDKPDKICYPELKKRVQFVLALIWDLANK
jgi:Zn-dependent M28 family amino/carboxypeptidase